MKRFCVLFFMGLIPLLLAQKVLPEPITGTTPRLSKSGATPKTKSTPKPNPHTVIVCLIDDRRLTQAEVDKSLDKLLAGKKGSEEQLEELRFVYTQNIMTEWLERNLLAAEAESEGIHVTEEELNKHEAELAKTAGYDVNIDDALTRIGQSREAYRRQLKDALLGEKLLRRRLQAYYSDQDLKNIYESNPDSFQRPPRVRVTHILYPFRGNESPDHKKSLKLWMEEARKKIKKGTDPEVILKQADSSMGVIGGDMGWLYPNNLLPEPLNSIVFKLKVGEVSDVLETQYGYYILRLEEKQPLFGTTYDEAREAVLDSVFEEVRQKVLQSAKFKHKIRINMSGIPKDKM
ncbi:peptidyl-prolyl cis-trans isomerase [Candidatus Sumerlaeota bacterium]|nr:peptidyl-prolyl cis-trans isomerase [Candidatus Sumerlaeota bacterium]